MNSVIGGLLVSGRSTVRSTAMPIATITANVMPNASAKGTPRSTRLTKVSAAKSSMAPCAKFSTPEVL